MKTLFTVNSILKNTVRSTFISTVLFSTSLFAGQAEINAIETASMQMNSQQLQVIAKQEQGYLQAFANYRLAIIQSTQMDNEKAEASLSSTIAILESVVSTSPKNDEAWALLAQSYGYMISFKHQQAQVLGAKSASAIQTAYQLNPENPRAMLFKGIMNFTTPEAYGGDKQKAITVLTKAISLYDNDRDSGHYWGEAEAYVWRGLSYQALNNNEQAHADFELALQISPNFAWAKMLLKNNA